jgi:phosphoribosylamine---glycine ligase
MMMKILVVGGGGREHALCWKLAQSPLCRTLWCAPGNAGIAQVATCLPLAADDLDGLVHFAVEQAVDLVVVGPEGPLVLGLVDRLTVAGIRAFGPTAAAAALEGSKGFMKDICARAGVPTAAYGRFSDADAALAFVRSHFKRSGLTPIVVKADGLAAGKGVTIAQTLAEAEAAVTEAMLDRRFGTAGSELVIEEFLDGEEASFFALCDGVAALPFGGAQDHKRAFDGDQGPNTGGMGAYAPAPVLTPAIEAEIMETIIAPTLAAMSAAGRPFTGVLFAGIMVVTGADGRKRPILLEFNTRFGDPECQVLMRRLESDLLPVLLAAGERRLADVSLRWHDQTALAVVMAARGYPGAFDRGSLIGGLEDAAASDPSIVIFHSGTTAVADSDSVAVAGGRVLAVSSMAPTVGAARVAAYGAIDRIRWPEGFCRRDIGWRAEGVRA